MLLVSFLVHAAMAGPCRSIEPAEGEPRLFAPEWTLGAVPPPGMLSRCLVEAIADAMGPVVGKSMVGWSHATCMLPGLDGGTIGMSLILDEKRRLLAGTLLYRGVPNESVAAGIRQQCGAPTDTFDESVATGLHLRWVGKTTITTLWRIPPDESFYQFNVMTIEALQRMKPPSAPAGR